MVGPTPAELESLNELIKFDHIYYKEEPSNSSCVSEVDISSNSVSRNLLSSRQLLPALAPKGLENLRSDLVPSSASSFLVVSSSASSIAISGATASSTWTTTSPSVVAPTVAVSKPKMVDPNAACGRVSVTVRNESSSPVATAGTVADIHFDAGEELLDIERLLGLTDLELTTNFQLEDQASHPSQIQQQQAVKVKGPDHQNAKSTVRKRKHSSTSHDGSQDAHCHLSSETVCGLETEFSSYEDAFQGSLSDSGISGDLSDAPSPGSDMSSVLGEEDWQSSFTELFPSLM